MNANEKISIQYQLEMIVDLMAQAQRLDMDGCDITHLPSDLFNEVSKRTWAVLYMVQAAGGGSRPHNYERVIGEVSEIDSAIQMRIVIDDARRGAE